MKIIIVDDNLDNLDMLTFMLKSQEHYVKTATNGKIALDMLRAEKFELIISDILMPVMDGYQLCRECKTDPALKNICFIFYTATYIDNKDEEFAYMIGAQGFIRKPVEPEEFMTLILQIVKKWEKFTGNVIIDEHNEKEILKLYNERLIAKLEKRNIDLEKEIQAHNRTINELILAKQKAEESDRLKSAFLANISHEIRTPMNGLLGFTNLLKDPDLTKEEREEFINIIEKSGKRLLNLINNIIDISKIEAGIDKIRITEFNLMEIIEFAYILFRPEAEKKGLKFYYVSKPSEKDIKICSDREKLYSILTNLIKNAINFTDTGSVEFGCNCLGDFVEFFVKDTGCGIAKDKQEIIFQKFTQADYYDKRAIQGAGLGLSICKAYAELLGGKIWVESEKGKGSTFYFIIPSKTKIDETIISENNINLIDKIKPVDFKRLQNLKILIAEDDEISYLYLKTLLRGASANIFYAKNGKEVIKIVEENPNIDIILLDIKMPEMDGFEVLQKVKSTYPNLPVIAITAYALSEEKEKILSMGCDDYIAKPFNLNVLLSKIDNFLKN